MKDRVVDNLDLKILRFLQDDAKITVKEIASKLEISAPTVKSRIDALQENGVIKGYYVEIDNSVFENVIKCFVEIEVSPDRKEELYKI
ncbi:MAG: Lrp/AsnC family transcriptional regulator, partial [Clostridia bacterium]|nr:Lrp/AsnC family transcriptional regulator [Clostridia bacterium]